MELYKDPNQPIEARVEDLLSRMTLEEKVAQLCGDLPASFIENGEFNKNLLREKFPHGLGRITQYSMVGLSSPEKIAKISNEIQRYFVEETRLGIPVALQSENLSGYPAAGGTIFPAMVNLGCTWEPELAERMSAIIGQESRSVGITSAMSPVIDVAQDPRWGRTYETFGEDPYLISQFGVNYVKGMQAQGVSCIAKHFLGYSATQAGLNTAACRMGSRELYEIFATPFEAADKLAGLDAMMANYGEIDGIPVIMNKEIIQTLLRDIMGFEGVLTSDGAAVLKLFNYFKVAKTYEEAGLLAKKAGADTEIPVGAAFRQLPKYVRSGVLDEECINASVRRVLTVKFKRGLFENPYCDEGKVVVSMSNSEKQALSEEIAAKSLVLLKNDGVLPLKKGTKIALIGPHADSLRYPISGYTYPAYLEMVKAGAGGDSTGFNGLEDEQKKTERESKKNRGPFATIYELFNKEEKEAMNDMPKILRDLGARTLKEVLEERFEVLYTQGCSITGKETDGFAEAVEISKDADVIVMACGGNSGWVNVTGGEGKDRQYLDLPGVQQQLLEAVAATGKPVVLILYGPGVFAVNWADKHCGAIIQAFLPGPYAGKVIADALDGSLNPGGKLTMTVPRTTGQIPIYYNHRVGSGYNSGADAAASIIFSGGYVDGPADPLYCFGHGLSYTSFALSDLQLSVHELPTNGKLEISCKVKNTGDVTGDETVQLYTSFTDAHVTRPNMQLSGFCRLTLKPGEEKTVTFHLDMAQLGYYNEFMEFVVEPGKMNIMLGTSSCDIKLEDSVCLVGTATNVMGKRVYTCPVEVKQA